VPEDKYLLHDYAFKGEAKSIEKEEFSSYIKQKPNKKILFFKFHLWLYNLSSKKRNDGWLKRIGEPPEIYDPALVNASEERLKQYLSSKGYFRSSIDIEEKQNERKRKTNIKYQISTGDQYKIKKINYCGNIDTHCISPTSTAYSCSCGGQCLP